MTDSEFFSTAPTPSIPNQTMFPMRVIGVGGAGCNAVAALAERGLPGLECVLMNTDAAALQRLIHGAKHVLGERTLRGLGSGGDAERAKAAAEEDESMIRKWCEGMRLVIVVAGLGGGTGTGATPVICKIAQEAGALVLANVILPFECEGTLRLRRANLGLSKIKEIADATIPLHNQAILKAIDEKTSLLDAFKVGNDFAAAAAGGLWRLLGKPGLINLDFSDVSTALKGRHSECVLASAEIKGDIRVGGVVERLLAHPLLSDGSALSTARQLIVSLVGGPELSMKEVHGVVEQLSRHAELAHVVMGAMIDEDMRGQMTVTVVATGGVMENILPAEEDEEIHKNAEMRTEKDGPLLREETFESEPKSGSNSRYIAPPPESNAESVCELASKQPRVTGRGKRRDVWKQGMLNLEIVSKGRFERSEPTIHRGEDLDIPTYVRRGVVLN